MASLHFADPKVPGYTRIRRGDGFVILSPRGKPVRDARTLKRVEALVIPPAWTSVWIAPLASCHIQAIGIDAKGRKQYIYHPDFRAEREAEKFRKLARFGARLPEIRARVAADMALPGLARDKVLASVVHLLDRTLIRIGNRTYAEANKSFGLSTLRSRHVEVAGSTIRFAFRGKSGQEWRVRIQDRRVARVIRACQGLPGQHLFQYVDDDGERRAVASDDVNAYLRTVGGPRVSAKDFRTWAGTVLCGVALSLAPPAEAERQRRRQVASAVRAVAYRLGNTPAVCRSAYIHPAVLTAHESGYLYRQASRLSHGEATDMGLTTAEETILRLLRKRNLGTAARVAQKAANSKGAGAKSAAGGKPKSDRRTSGSRARAAEPLTANGGHHG